MYTRQIAMPSIGHQGQSRLSSASVLVIGAGGLGSSALFCLAGAGIGTIAIIDSDTVSKSNLNRQFLYQAQDLDNSKVMQAQSRLQALNPHIEIIAINEKLQANNAERYMQKYDYILDCADSHSLSLLINDYCYFLEKPYVSASISRFSGFLCSFNGIEGPCFRCWNRLMPTSGQDCIVDGIIGSVATIFGALQANEIIKAIAHQSPMMHSVILFDTVTNSLQSLTITQQPNCPACIKKQKPHANNIEIDTEQIKWQETLLFDIRPVPSTPHFAVLPNRYNYRQIDEDTMLDTLATVDKNTPIVLICQHGIRSIALAKKLRLEGFTRAHSLTNGIKNTLFCKQMSELAALD